MVAMVLGTLATFGQSWKYENRKDAFDGDFQLAYVVGKGSFPYNSPLLAVRYRGREGLNIILTNVNSGLSGVESIKMVFDNQDTVYEYVASTSDDGELWFVNESKDTIMWLANKFKTSSNVTIRLSTEYSHGDYEFTLRGSTAAINKLVK